MSGELDYACSFSDSNSEIYNLIRFGGHKQDPSSIREILNDKYVKAKLSKALNFYSKPNSQSKAKLNDSLKWAGTQALTNMMKTFLSHLSLKLDLDEELTFRLVELFFIMHPILFEKVKNTENEEVKKELSASMKPITHLYYKERINLLKALTALVLNTTHEDNPCQGIFMEYFQDYFTDPKLEDVIWQQFTESCKRELPSQVLVPNEREEWFLQILDEQKMLLELLVICNYTYSHTSAEKYFEYLTLYVRQDFQGSFKSIERDLQLSEYRIPQKKLIQEIGDLCVFHLLSSIRLDVFGDKGAIPEINLNRNPFILINDKDFTPKINNFFTTLAEGPEFVSEHIGPVLVSWIALLVWGKGLPPSYTVVSNYDMSQIEDLASHYYIFDFLQKISKREPFIGSSPELACALKYTLMSLISRLHTVLHVETVSNYSLLVKTTCACLENIGSNNTLSHFWNEDFKNKSGLFLMLQILSKKYPHNGEEFLQFVSVLIGDSTCCFASEIVEYLDKLQYFTVAVDKNAIVEDSHGVFVCAHELSSSRIVISKDTLAEVLEQVSRDQVLVTWKVRFSLWPVLFNYWENFLDKVKQGHPIVDYELKVLGQYLEILCKVLILEPRLGPVLEENGLRQPANHPLEVKVIAKPREIPNLTLSEYFFDTFIELSRSHSPPLITLGSILEALKNLYLTEIENTAKNPLATSLKKVALERHGYGNLNAPHPIFVSLNKLRVFEKSAEDFSVTFSMLEFCITVFEDHTCMRNFSMSSSSFLAEALKYCLSEVLPEVLNMNGLYRWRNTHLVLSLLSILLDRYSEFVCATQSCAFIEMISSNLNKTNISGLLETVLQVVVQQNDFGEISFFNIHWAQTEDIEELSVIKSMIATALKVLEKLLAIVLHLHQVPNSSNLVIQAAGDIYKLIYYNQSGEELPLVSALLSYVPFYLKNSLPEDNDQENIASLSLRCLSKIVMIWEKSNQKAVLDYFTAGIFQEVKKEFFETFKECFGETSNSYSFDVNVAVTISFLEFLVLAVPSQKNFVGGMLTNMDFANNIKKQLQSLRDLSKESIEVTALSMLFHILALYEGLVEEPKKYQALTSTLLQDISLFNSAVETVQSLLFVKKDPQGFELCLFLHCYAAIFRILTNYLQQKQGNGTIDLVFCAEFLENYLNLSARVLSSESTLVRLQDYDVQLSKINLVSGTSEFLTAQFHKSPVWRLFESNHYQYGQYFKYNSLKLSILLSNFEMPYELIKAGISTFNACNIESSLLDSQLTGLQSFKSLLAYVTSFGYSSKPLSALHIDIPTSEVKSLLISGKKVLHENIREAFEFISIIVDSTWNDIRSQSNLKSMEVVNCINQKFEVLMFCFSYIIHLTSTKMQQRSDDSEKSKVGFRRLSGKVLAEVVDFFTAVKQPSHEMLAFTLMMLSYFAKTLGFESKPEDYIYALAQHLSKFLHPDSTNFALITSCLEYSLQLSDKKEYVNVFKSLSANRVLIEKLLDEKCSDLEALSILKYFVCMSKTASGAKFLISLRIFQYLNNFASIKKINNEYEGRHRSPKHVLWCWTLILLSQICEVLSNDLITFSQLLGFFSTFNSRITKVLEFNYVENNNRNGEIIEQKQFSMAYLEELEIILSLLNRVIDGYAMLKKSDQEKVDFWLSIMGVHTLRIFANNTDTVYAFPAITEHELKVSVKTLQESLAERTIPEQPRQKRSIFEPIPRVFSSESKQKKGTSVSVFTYRVQTLQVLVLESILSTLINSFQISRTLPPIDINALLGASKLLVSSYTLITNNPSFYANLDKITAEEFRDPEVTAVVGGLSQRYDSNFNNLLKTCKRSFEMVFYLVLKFDLNKNIDLKQNCANVVRDWIKVTEAETFKGEPSDPFLAYLKDQINS